MQSILIKRQLRRLGGVTLLLLGIASAAAQPSAEPTAWQRAEQLDIKPLTLPRLQARGFEGVTVLYDGETEQWHSTSPTWFERQAIPASTFKVMSSLAALESGVVTSLDQRIALAQYTSSREEINRELDFASAFKLSALPHYQQLVRRIGSARMQRYLDVVGYGNRDMGGGHDQFWIAGDLKISPRQQIEFLRRLVADDLPLRTVVMAQVRQIMRRDELGGRLRAKTGWATSVEGLHTGWSIGWLEREDAEPLFFATLLQTDALGDSFLDIRLGLSLDAVTQYNQR